MDTPSLDSAATIQPVSAISYDARVPPEEQQNPMGVMKDAGSLSIPRSAIKAWWPEGSDSGFDSWRSLALAAQLLDLALRRLERRLAARAALLDGCELGPQHPLGARHARLDLPRLVPRCRRRLLRLHCLLTQLRERARRFAHVCLERGVREW